MNALTNATSTNTILAIDLGKYKSVACIHNQATGEVCFTSFETSRSELRRCSSTSRIPSPAGRGRSVFTGFALFAGLRNTRVPGFLPVPRLDAFGRHGADVGW